MLAPILAPAIQTNDSASPESAPRVGSPAFARELTTQLQIRGPTATPLRGSQAAQALSDAYRTVFGDPPSRQTLAVLVSQWSLETGGGQAMMNYNFGGIKGHAPGGGAASYRTTEGSGESARSVVDTFRAYGSAREGALDYMRLLRSRFPAALSQARAGNPAGFVHSLKRAGYFTGSEADYTRAVTATAARVLHSGFDAASAGGPTGGAGAAPFGGSSDLSPDARPATASDIYAFSQELDLAALRIGDDRKDESIGFGDDDRASKGQAI